MNALNKKTQKTKKRIVIKLAKIVALFLNCHWREVLGILETNFPFINCYVESVPLVD